MSLICGESYTQSTLITIAKRLTILGMEKNSAISQYMAEIGRRGGKTVTQARKEAAKANLKKANAARLKRKPGA